MALTLELFEERLFTEIWTSMAFSHIDKLELQSGFLLTSKFEVKEMLGHGWEGEVYSIQERSTGIERAAKIFYPERNIKNRSATTYAKKLHKLRGCDVLIKYLFQDQIRYKGNHLTFLISEYIEGETLDIFLHRQKGKRLHYFQALHLLYILSQGLEEIHRAIDLLDDSVFQHYNLGTHRHCFNLIMGNVNHCSLKLLVEALDF